MLHRDWAEMEAHKSAHVHRGIFQAQSNYKPTHVTGSSSDPVIKIRTSKILKSQIIIIFYKKIWKNEYFKIFQINLCL